LVLASAAEAYSDHPIARSIRNAAANLSQIDKTQITDAREITGRGVQICLDGAQLSLGNALWMHEQEIAVPNISEIGTVLYLAKNRTYLGYLLISDTLKPQAQSAITELKALGIQKTVMLTGDKQAVAQKIGCQLGIDHTVAECLPDSKVMHLEQLLAEMPRRSKLAFVGDGINDAPVLALADVGIAMGALGTDAAIEAADVVLTDDNPQKIATAIQIARKTVRIAKQNIVFSLAIKSGVMLLGALGLAGMWAAVFADVGVCVLAIFNALRTMRTNKI
ncbi:MAG: HAD-IC family P-type ATPase, partial [Clostridia bacterium]|nr:HAD-IC family P-type ATPase [Clostridia bacterium]